jgi:polysaccharide pyruvyl transferase WcaK-like protein
VERLLRIGAGAVVLFPHVILRGGIESESDIHASETLVETLPVDLRSRVFVARGYQFPTEAKSLIRRLDWFSGTRLHSTIAALSSGIPSASIAYSEKAMGIFESLGVGSCVSDGRELTGAEVVEHQLLAFLHREQHRAEIARRLPGLLAIADWQMDQIATLFTTASRRSPALGA